MRRVGFLPKRCDRGGLRVCLCRAATAARATDTAVILTLEAFRAGVLAWIFLGEAIRPIQALGGAAILAAVVLIALGPSERRTREAPAAV